MSPLGCLAPMPGSQSATEKRGRKTNRRNTGKRGQDLKKSNSDQKSRRRICASNRIVFGKTLLRKKDHQLKLKPEMHIWSESIFARGMFHHSIFWPFKGSNKKAYLEKYPLARDAKKDTRIFSNYGAEIAQVS